jgi:hypothetical protein
LGACHDPLPTSVLSMKPSDATAAVACSSPHTTETAYIFQLRRPTRQQAGLYADACRQKMLTYLGFGPSGPPAPAPDYPIRYRWYIPTPSQVADGQSWARCDNGTWADTRFTQVAERTQSLKDVISHNSSALWLCLDQPYMPTRDQRLTFCTKPHRAEVTALKMHVPSNGHYPAKAKLLRAGHKQCAALLSKRRREAVGQQAGVVDQTTVETFRRLQRPRGLLVLAHRRQRTTRNEDTRLTATLSAK